MTRYFAPKRSEHSQAKCVEESEERAVTFRTLAIAATVGIALSAAGAGIARSHSVSARRELLTQRGPAGAYFTFAASELLVGGPSRGLLFS
jgi:uncharacterized protein YaaW (UPF0174 family)